MAALRDHDGIDHDRNAGKQAQSLSDCLDDAEVTEHASLDRADLEVAGNGSHLGQHELGRRGMNGLHPERVLRGKRGDRTCTVDAQRCEGPQVCLDAGAAGGIRAGDG
jgi:hypothetical protein